MSWWGRWDDVSLRAMFFGLIPHDRLNYAAIKTEKCPPRAFAGGGLFECFTSSSIAFNVALESDWKVLPKPMTKSSSDFHWKAQPDNSRGFRQLAPFHVCITQQLHHHRSLHCCEFERRKMFKSWIRCAMFRYIFYCMAFFSVLLFFFFSLVMFLQIKCPWRKGIR